MQAARSSGCSFASYRLTRIRASGSVTKEMSRRITRSQQGLLYTEQRKASPASEPLPATCSDFLDLPSDLKEAVLMKIEAQQGISAAVNTRLLSKAWRSAFDTYQGHGASISTWAKGSSHFQELCNRLPQMRSLKIVTLEVATDLSPLSSLGLLTSLSLSPTWKVYTCKAALDPAHHPSLSMAMLPASLKRMELCHVKMWDVQQMTLPYLTWLSLEGAESLPHEVRLLPQLSNLKELCVKSAPFYPRCFLEDTFAGPLESLHALTKLDLSYGVLLGEPSSFDWQNPFALRELCLSGMIVDSYYIGLLSNELPCITALSLNSCKIEWSNIGEEIEPEQKPTQMLQSLKLVHSSRGFLGIASKDLPELHLAEDTFPEDKSPDLESSLCRFTSLTRLVIDDYESRLALTRQTLAPIAELVVIDSTYPESIICELDGLTSLQKLHLEAPKPEWEECGWGHSKYDEYEHDSEERKSELQRAATALLSLPQLSQVTGECKLISEYLAKHLSSWKRCDVSSRDLKVPYKSGDRKLPMWTKT